MHPIRFFGYGSALTPLWKLTMLPQTLWTDGMGITPPHSSPLDDYAASFLASHSELGGKLTCSEDLEG